MVDCLSFRQADEVELCLRFLLQSTYVSLLDVDNVVHLTVLYENIHNGAWQRTINVEDIIYKSKLPFS